ncbi:MAG: transposase [Chromatiaceae bacterium]|nr:transposase [Gammaproteobacteria bacterium]MCP5317975.1 transposase [Chromatiaceae bacterium]MCW5586188.1 transposase [Chromatiales bacterium]MCP5430027.1 transposase [Chromatiaceae bacterium]MCP5435425.1 transposase [Chromatiaceae bacterium]
MGKPRFTEEQVMAVLREADAGVTIQDLCRKYGMSRPTFYKWRARHNGEVPSDARRLKKLEEENRRLRSLVADLTLRNQALQQALSKNW